nr:hypothetical protein [Tanacetum cinerariifolium]
MVAYLEKSVENADFSEVVDFLNANPIRAATTAASLEAEQDSGCSSFRNSKVKEESQEVGKEEKVKNSTTLEEGRYDHDIKVNTASTLITTANINITTAEPVTTVSAPITTAGVSVSTAEPSTPPTTTITLIKDEDLIIAQTLMKMKSVKSKEKSKEKGVSSTRLTRGVIMKEASNGKKAESSRKEAVSKKRTERELDQESSKRQKTSESSKLAKEPRDKEADELP